MEPVTVEQQLVIRGGSLGKVPWVIKNTETLEGRQFILLQRKDTGLCRFITAQSQMNPMKDYVFSMSYGISGTNT